MGKKNEKILAALAELKTDFTNVLFRQNQILDKVNVDITQKNKYRLLQDEIETLKMALAKAVKLQDVKQQTIETQRKTINDLRKCRP